MDTFRNQNKLLKLAPRTTKGTKQISELRQLIVELMRPKLAQLRQILVIHMVPVTRDSYHDDADDWWPDYEIFSDCHAISDMNGFLVLTQDILRGLPEDMRSIRKKFDCAYSAAKPENLQFKAKKYCLVEELIQDLINFVVHFSHLCTKILKERRILHDMAAQTRDTADRIKVKIFDESTFVQLQTRIGSLRNYVRDFCALFEAGVETKEEAAVGPRDKLNELQGPLQSGAVDRARR